MENSPGHAIPAPMPQNPTAAPRPVTVGSMLESTHPILNQLEKSLVELAESLSPVTTCDPCPPGMIELPELPEDACTVSRMVLDIHRRLVSITQLAQTIRKNLQL